MSTIEKIKFVEHEKPSLKAGKYTLTTKQEVKVEGKQYVDPKLEGVSSSAGKKTIHFGVKGDRFRLNPSTVHSTFPPENGDGVYGDVLPHIILNKATLPWEYSVDKDLEMEGSDNSDAPWLALLVFNENQIAEKTNTDSTGKLVSESSLTVEELLRENIIKSYSVGEEEKKDQICQTINVPKTLVEQHFPKKGDLKWLTHVRSVSTVDKTDAINAKGILKDGDITATFSAIIANRLPDEKTTSIVYLVSFQGRENDLPGDITADHATFVYLKKWTFYTQPSLGRVHDYLDNKSGLVPSTFRLPNEKVENSSLRKYFSDGFIPANHTTRKNDRMVSWYRSALVPFKSTIENFDRETLYTNADAATLYDTDLGMFNVAYAAAWKLGQLLTLRNSRIAQKLYLSKGKLKEDAQRNFEIKELKGDRGSDQSREGVNTEIIKKLEKLLKDGVPESIGLKLKGSNWNKIENQFASAKSAGFNQTNFAIRNKMITSYHAVMAQKTKQLEKIIDFSNKEQVDAFLDFRNKMMLAFSILREELNPNVKDLYIKRCKAILKNNKGVDNLTLKNDPKRKQWDEVQEKMIQKTLGGLNGACLKAEDTAPIISNDEDEEITQWFAELELLKGIPLAYIVPSLDLLPLESLRFFYVDGNWINALLDGANSIGSSTELDNSIDQIQTVTRRKKCTKYAFDVRNKVQLNGFVKSDGNERKTVSGILLHSQLVDDWPGLEIMGYANSSAEKLPLLRMEKLREGVLLCLFKGELDKLEIQEPSEGVHYGFSKQTEKEHIIALKNPREKNAIAEKNDDPTVVIKNEDLFRDWKKNKLRVIDLDKLQEIVKKKVTELYYSDGADYNFNSAEFAVQMIRRMHHITIQTKDK